MEDYKTLEMIIYEAFIRRASELNLPFMLKGSYVTRQYFQHRNDRIPNDLDWVYLNYIEDVENHRTEFDQWVTQVTESWEKDGVTFRSFKENAFWRRIDYAMFDDFPTVNTDLSCWVDNQLYEGIALDISFNLDIEVPPVPLLYQPLRGQPFTIPYTVPLALQVSWKLHQTMVRPRFKDIFDLIHLLQHPSFDEKTLEQTLQALVNECTADKTSLIALERILSNHLESLFPKSITTLWDFWRHEIFKSDDMPYDFSVARQITDVSKLPQHFTGFKNQLMTSLRKAGFHEGLMNDLPQPTRKIKDK